MTKSRNVLSALALAALASSQAHAVLNGDVIAESRFPSVKKVRIGSDGICTGTFIRPRTMVTAGHCINAAVVEGMFSSRLDLNVEGHLPVGYKVHPKYAGHAVDMLAFDVAVVEFGADTDFMTTPISSREGHEGDAVTIVGYGQVRGVAGTKRMGQNVIYQSMWGQFMIQGGLSEGSPATGTQGDSGGPLFNDSGELIGVTSRESGPGMVLNGEPTRMSSYIDANEPEVRKFIDSATDDLEREAARKAASGRRGD